MPDRDQQPIDRAPQLPALCQPAAGFFINPDRIESYVHVDVQLAHAAHHFAGTCQIVDV